VNIESIGKPTESGIVYLDRKSTSLSSLAITNFDQKQKQITLKHSNNNKERQHSTSTIDFISPLQQFRIGTSVNSIHLSPQAELCLFVGDNAKCEIFQTTSTEYAPLRTLNGHVGMWVCGFVYFVLLILIVSSLGDVLCGRFFTSGQVALTGGSDCQLKIWDILNEGLCAATMRGHSGSFLVCFLFVLLFIYYLFIVYLFQEGF
jgi:hypothetical protein